MLKDENIKGAFKKYKKGKSTRRSVIEFSKDEQKSIEKYKRLAQNYPQFNHIPKTINDGINRKVRTIIVPKEDEQVIQHMAFYILAPIMLNSMYQHSYGSIDKRGADKGRKKIEKWIKDDKKNTKYYLQMDIRKYFESIPHGILKNKLRKLIKDDKFYNLIVNFFVIKVNEELTTKGLPLGMYSSQ